MGGGDDEIAFVFAGGRVEDYEEVAGGCGRGVGMLVGWVFEGGGGGGRGGNAVSWGVYGTGERVGHTEVCYTGFDV